MNKTDLAERYRGYIACLNEQDWPGLGTFVHDEVHYNGQRVGLAGYRAMLRTTSGRSRTFASTCNN